MKDNQEKVKVNRITDFLVWTYFSQFDFVGLSIKIMEVAKVNKLSLELNKMGIKHIIFTLDNVSTKTFGDSTTLKRLKDSPELKAGVHDILQKSKRTKDDLEQVCTTSNVRLLETNSLHGKGSAQIRSQCTQLLQFCGFGLKDRKLKYGEGPAPPGWPSPLDWSSFRGPGKHSSDMCIEIIVGLKHDRNKKLLQRNLLRRRMAKLKKGRLSRVYRRIQLSQRRFMKGRCLKIKLMKTLPKKNFQRFIWKENQSHKM